MEFGVNRAEIENDGVSKPVVAPFAQLIEYFRRSPGQGCFVDQPRWYAVDVAQSGVFIDGRRHPPRRISWRDLCATIPPPRAPNDAGSA